MASILVHDEKHLLGLLSSQLSGAGYDVMPMRSRSLYAEPRAPEFSLILWTLQVPRFAASEDADAESLQPDSSDVDYALMASSKHNAIEVLAQVRPLFEPVALQKIDVILKRDAPGTLRLHAVARWADALAPIINSPTDPRTVSDWASLIFVSPGALRNWCHTAGMSPRHSLLFARLLRAVLMCRHGKQRPEQLLDVVDSRTIKAMLLAAGFGAGKPMPVDVAEFLAAQNLIKDSAVLAAVRDAIINCSNGQLVA